MAKVTIREIDFISKKGPMARFDWSDGKNYIKADFTTRSERLPALNSIVDTIADYTDNFLNECSLKEINVHKDMKAKFITVDV